MHVIKMYSTLTINVKVNYDKVHPCRDVILTHRYRTIVTPDALLFDVFIVSRLRSNVILYVSPLLVCFAHLR